MLCYDMTCYIMLQDEHPIQHSVGTVSHKNANKFFEIVHQIAHGISGVNLFWKLEGFGSGF